jgi:hypothetical protein
MIKINTPIKPPRFGHDIISIKDKNCFEENVLKEYTETHEFFGRSRLLDNIIIKIVDEINPQEWIESVYKKHPKDYKKDLEVTTTNGKVLKLLGCFPADNFNETTRELPIHVDQVIEKNND